MFDRQAYIEFLLDHYQNPRNRGRDENADIVISGANPSCGDVVTIYVRVGPGERIVRVQFEGEGCTISQAGASIIAEMADDRPIADFESMGIDEIVDLMGRDVVMSRVRCATVGLGTLQAGLKEYREKASRGDPPDTVAPSDSH